MRVEERGSKMKKSEFNRRFADHMVSKVGDKFGDGASVMEYAESVAPSYWDEYDQGGSTPEECAEIDMDHWQG